MKRMRKLIAVVMAMTILLAFSAPTFAVSPSSSDAQKCEALGVLLGSGSGVNAQYLATATTRAQGATLLLRLMGKEDQAQAYAGKDNFKDIAGNEWFASRLAYLKANPSLGFGGYPDGTFLPHKIMTVAEFNKVLATVLGYKQDLDYTWNNVMNFSRNIGLVGFFDGSKSLTNNDVAISIIDAMVIKKKGTNETLTEFLISQGVVSASVADSIGLISRSTILSAKATNDNEITVVFNKAMPVGTNVTLKSGNASVFTTLKWSTDRTQVVITRVGPFMAGTYSLTVGDIPTLEISLTASVPTTMELTTNTILIGENATITPVVYNQYGKDMKVNARSAYIITAFNRTTGATLMVNPSTWAINTVGAKEGETVTVTVMHVSSTLVGQFDLKVIKQPVVSSFTLIEIVPANNKNNIVTNEKGLVVKYEAYDQYGNPLVIKNKEGLTFVSSNENMLKTTNIYFNSLGVMTVDVGSIAGTVNLSVLCNASASVTSLPISIFDPIGIADLRIYYPNDSVVSGEATELSYNITDQFGSALSKTQNYTEINKWMTINSLNQDIVLNSDIYVEANGAMYIKPSGVKGGTAVVYYLWKGKPIDTLTINVSEPAVPTAVVGVDANLGIEKGAAYQLPMSAIKIVDQYGRPYDPVAHGLTMDNFHIIGDGNIIQFNKVNATGTINFLGMTEGSMSFTIGINNAGNFLPGSENTFSMRVYDVDLATNSVLFAFNPINTIYANSGFTGLGNAGDYARPVTVYGKAPDGTTIALKQDKITNLLSSNPKFVTAHDGTAWRVYSTSATATDSTILRAYNGAKLLCEITVNSSMSRGPKTIEFGPDIVTTVAEVNGNANVVSFQRLNFRILDEYGVNMLMTTVPTMTLPSTYGFFTSSNPEVMTVDSSGNLSAKKAGTVTLTYTSVFGVQDSIQLTIR
ncbi:MAG TPA: hypothetical protein DDZ89_11955 [Clostridiales bacterium]|nr:hypothetical protein [Clostridiales bacterium]